MSHTPRSGATAGSTTVGVAVPVPEPYGDELQGWRRTFGDPMADLIPAHITLVPPVELSAAEREIVDEYLATAATQVAPFGVQLRGTGTFRPVSPVVFVALAAGIAECELLSDAVRCGPLKVDRAFPYHPHVTVVHHLGEDVMDRAFDTLAGYAAAFDVDSFSLYEHGADGYWRQVADFALTGESSSAD